MNGAGIPVKTIFYLHPKTYIYTYSVARGPSNTVMVIPGLEHTLRRVHTEVLTSKYRGVCPVRGVSLCESYVMPRLTIRLSSEATVKCNSFGSDLISALLFDNN